jgi:hypothetical protein
MQAVFLMIVLSTTGAPTQYIATTEAQCRAVAAMNAGARDKAIACMAPDGKIVARSAH